MCIYGCCVLDDSGGRGVLKESIFYSIYFREDFVLVGKIEISPI